MSIQIGEKDNKLILRVVGDIDEATALKFAQEYKKLLGPLCPGDISIEKVDPDHRHDNDNKHETVLDLRKHIH